MITLTESQRQRILSLAALLLPLLPPDEAQQLRQLLDELTDQGGLTQEQFFRLTQLLNTYNSEETGYISTPPDEEVRPARQTAANAQAPKRTPAQAAQLARQLLNLLMHISLRQSSQARSQGSRPNVNRKR